MRSFPRTSRAAGWLGVLLLGVAPAACHRGSPAPQSQAPAAPVAPKAPAAPKTPDDSGRPKIVVLGDSLTAGYGLLELQAFPALVPEKLNTEGYQWDVVNAGISGD